MLPKFKIKRVQKQEEREAKRELELKTYDELKKQFDAHNKR